MKTERKCLWFVFFPCDFVTFLSFSISNLNLDSNGMQPIILLNRISSNEMKRHAGNGRSSKAVVKGTASAAADDVTSPRQSKLTRRHKSPKEVPSGKTVDKNEIPTKPTRTIKTPPKPMEPGRALRKRNA